MEYDLYSDSSCNGSKTNVVGAIDGGFMALLAGLLVVAVSFIFVPIISNFKRK